MATIIDAVYEDGVLRPLNPHDLEERQRYRLIVETIGEPETTSDPALAAEIARRTTILPDGRRIVDILGLFDRGERDLIYEDIDATLDEFGVRLPMR